MSWKACTGCTCPMEAPNGPAPPYRSGCAVAKFCACCAGGGCCCAAAAACCWFGAGACCGAGCGGAGAGCGSWVGPSWLADGAAEGAGIGLVCRCCGWTARWKLMATSYIGKPGGPAGSIGCCRKGGAFGEGGPSPGGGGPCGGTGGKLVGRPRGGRPPGGTKGRPPIMGGPGGGSSIGGGGPGGGPIGGPPSIGGPMGGGPGGGGGGPGGGPGGGGPGGGPPGGPPGPGPGGPPGGCGFCAACFIEVIACVMALSRATGTSSWYCCSYCCATSGPSITRVSSIIARIVFSCDHGEFGSADTISSRALRSDCQGSGSWKYFSRISCIENRGSPVALFTCESDCPSCASCSVAIRLVAFATTLTRRMCSNVRLSISIPPAIIVTPSCISSLICPSERLRLSPCARLYSRAVEATRICL